MLADIDKGALPSVRAFHSSSLLEGGTFVFDFLILATLYVWISQAHSKLRINMQNWPTPTTQLVRFSEHVLFAAASSFVLSCSLRERSIRISATGFCEEGVGGMPDFFFWTWGRKIRAQRRGILRRHHTIPVWRALPR